MTTALRRVDSLDIPELEPYRTLKRPLEHRAAGFFIAEGEKVVHRLLLSSLRIRSILLTEQWLDVYRRLIDARTERPDILIAEKKVMEGIVGFELHKGIMAMADVPDTFTIEEVTRKSSPPFLFVAVDGIMNSENLGVIVRNCASFGVTALLVGENSCDPYLRRAVRNSMGNIFDLPIVRLSKIPDELARLRASWEITVIGAHPHPESRVIGRVDLTSSCCLVLGAEGHGISDGVLKACDFTATVPMQKGVDSLNVASASAVLLYEAQRQRRKKEAHGVHL